MDNLANGESVDLLYRHLRSKKTGEAAIVRIGEGDSSYGYQINLLDTGMILVGVLDHTYNRNWHTYQSVEQFYEKVLKTTDWKLVK